MTLHMMSSTILVFILAASLFWYVDSSTNQLIPFEEECIAQVMHMIGADGSRTQLMCTVNGLLYLIPSADEQWIKEQMALGELISDETIMTLPGDAMLNQYTHEIHMTEPPSLRNNETEERESRRRLRRLATIGSKTVLVVRVQATDATSTLTAAQLGDYVFGDDGSTLNLKAQTEACSYNGLMIDKASTRTGLSTTIANGIVTIPVRVATNVGELAMINSITSALQTEFGVSVSDLADHVMYCFPPGTTAVATLAYAILGGFMSFYNDQACAYPSAQLHEIGHNYNLGHSSDSSNEYGDKSGIMGFSYTYTFVPYMCFNAAKSWQLGWYTSKADSITPSSNSATYSTKLAGIVDYGTTSNKVLVEIRQTSSPTFYYINYNRAIGINFQTQEGPNNVLVVSKDTSVDSNISMSQAMLGAGESFTVNNFNGNSGETLTITFTSLQSNEANVDIVLTGFQSNPTESPGVPSSSPSASYPPSASRQPSRSVAPTSQTSTKPSTSTSPSTQPSSQPSLIPSVEPSKTSSTAPSNSQLPSLSVPMDFPSKSMQPSSDPSRSAHPSVQPSEEPSLSTNPTLQSSTEPSSSISPSRQPSYLPSLLPSVEPSNVPSKQPSSIPSRSAHPSVQPSEQPSCSMLPTSHTSATPSTYISPSRQPSYLPSQNPSVDSSKRPSFLPSLSLSTSNAPSNSEVISFSTRNPSGAPSILLSISPRKAPSVETPFPSRNPNVEPSKIPSISPSKAPSKAPSDSAEGTLFPTIAVLQPSTAPSVSPSKQQSSLPSMRPSKLQPFTNPSVSVDPSTRPSLRPSLSFDIVPTSVLSALDRTETISVELRIDGQNNLDAAICMVFEAFISKSIQDAYGKGATSTVVCTGIPGNEQIRHLQEDAATFLVMLTVTTTFAAGTTAPEQFEYLYILEELAMSDRALRDLGLHIQQALDATSAQDFHVTLVYSPEKQVLIVAFEEDAPTSTASPTAVSDTTNAPGSPSGARAVQEYIVPLLLCSIIGGIRLV